MRSNGRFLHARRSSSSCLLLTSILGVVGIWHPLRRGDGPARIAYQKKIRPISSGILMSAIPIPIHPRIRPAVARFAL
jgi:hypothetical protein